MIATAGAGVATVQHEFFGAEPRKARLLVERDRIMLELVPVSGRVDVHFDHARIGGDLQKANPR